jgi:hypothetical protein
MGYLISLLYLFPINTLADGSYFYDQPRYCYHCQCTDLGRYRNPCISDRRYCEAFGNIGAR